MTRRRTLQKIDEIEVLEGELIDKRASENNDLYANQQARDHEFRMKTLESLPQAINIVQQLVEIKNIQANSEAEIAKMDKQIAMITEETEAFVRQEIAKRETMHEKGETANRLLQSLYRALEDSDASDEIKKDMINTFNLTMDKVLAE